MRQPADRDEIDAGGGDLRRVSGVTRPEASVMARPSTSATASARCAGAHIVEQHGVRALRQRFGSWSSESTSISILTRWPTLARARAQRRRDAAGDGDVIVLDQHRVIEAEAVIAAAAGAHRIFLQRAQARRRLARADDLRLVPATACDEARGRGGDAAEMAEKIQRDALGRQDAARRAGDVAMRSPGATAAPSVRSTRKRDARIDQLEGEPREIEPGDDARPAARRARRVASAPAGTTASRREVAGAARDLRAAQRGPAARS